MENVMGQTVHGGEFPETGLKRLGCLMLAPEKGGGREVGDGGIEAVEGVVEVGGGARAGEVAVGCGDYPEGEDFQHRKAVVVQALLEGVLVDAVVHEGRVVGAQEGDFSGPALVRGEGLADEGGDVARDHGRGRRTPSRR